MSAIWGAIALVWYVGVALFVWISLDLLDEPEAPKPGGLWPIYLFWPVCLPLVAYFYIGTYAKRRKLR